MRIRSIKPEFWRSPSIAALDPFDRLLFIGLWSYVDDHGRGRDDDAEIIGDLFSRDMFANPRDTAAKVRDGLARLLTGGLIMRYSTPDGGCYLQITNWTEHQRVDRPRASLFPAPDQGIAKPREDAAINREDDTKPRDASALEQGAGSREQGTGNAHPSGARIREMFDEFWDMWPLKKGKQPAAKAFEKAIKNGADFEAIKNGVERYKREIGPAPDWSKVKWPQGWLNDARWEDEPTPSASPATGGRREEMRDGFLFVNGKPVMGGPNGMNRDQFDAWKEEQRGRRS